MSRRPGVELGSADVFTLHAIVGAAAVAAAGLLAFVTHYGPEIDGYSVARLLALAVLAFLAAAWLRLLYLQLEAEAPAGAELTYADVVGLYLLCAACGGLLSLSALVSLAMTLTALYREAFTSHGHALGGWFVALVVSGLGAWGSAAFARSVAAGHRSLMKQWQEWDEDRRLFAETQRAQIEIVYRYLQKIDKLGRP